MILDAGMNPFDIRQGHRVFDPYRIAGPVLRTLPPETAHRLALKALALGLASVGDADDDPVLACHPWGLDFANPIGLSAGFDKEAEVMDAILAAGFGFTEAGTVTPLPQPGNPRPRLFRLTEDRAVINRLGFNSGGLAGFAGRFARRRRDGRGPVGANVGRNKETPEDRASGDFETGIEAMARLADYLVINISSPNTPGLRAMQRRGPLEELIGRCLAARDRGTPPDATAPPLLVKIAPDLDEQEMSDIATLARETALAGLIVANTTTDRPATLRSPARDQAGGLSGPPLFERALRCVGDMYRLTGGDVTLVGCGGIASGDDAYAMIRAGASLVQLYSALVYEGPRLVVRIKRELAARLRADGFDTVAKAVGADHSRTA